MMIHKRALRTSFIAGLSAAMLVCAPVSFSADEKPDLSDWIPRKSKLGYDKDKAFEKLQKELEKVKKGRASIHNVKTCKAFVKLFDKEKTLKRFDTININFSKECEITETLTIIKGIKIISAKGISETSFDPFYNQNLNRNYDDLLADRKGVFGKGFLCNTKAAPCFIIDTPEGQRTTISGLSFRVKEALFAPLLVARSGRMTAEYNLFQGATINTGSARQGPAIMAENESSTIESNTFVDGDEAIRVYPYTAMRSGDFSSAFKIGLNVITTRSGDGIILDGTYRFGARPEVKVYLFGNLAYGNYIGIRSEDVQAYLFRNILHGNDTHLDVSGGELLVEQNIMRQGNTAIAAFDKSLVYIDSNLFDSNELVTADILKIFEGGSPYPSNNICRNQNIGSFYAEDLKYKKVLQGGGWSDVRVRRGWRGGTKIEKEFKKDQMQNVASHVLFSRPFLLNPADQYKNCFDLSKVVALDASQLDKNARNRLSRDTFFDGDGR